VAWSTRAQVAPSHALQVVQVAQEAQEAQSVVRITPADDAGRPAATPPEPAVATAPPNKPRRSAAINTAAIAKGVDVAPAPPATAEAPVSAEWMQPLTAQLRLPRFAAQLPPSQTWHFDVRLVGVQPAGAPATGRAVLSWVHEASGAYTLAFSSKAIDAVEPAQPHLADQPPLPPQVGRLPTHDWHSRGRVDATWGLMPERMVTRGQGRSGQAVNFDHDTQQAWFSSRARTAQPLAPGGQDRLSWLLQLVGVVAANPALHVDGAELPLQVIGPRGEHGTWTFVARGLVNGVDQARAHPQAQAQAQAQALALEPVLRFERTAEHPHDTDVVVWLQATPPHRPLAWQWHLRASRAPPTQWLLRGVNLDTDTLREDALVSGPRHPPP
jgi:hypothetical protein